MEEGLQNLEGGELSNGASSLLELGLSFYSNGGLTLGLDRGATREVWT